MAKENEYPKINGLYKRTFGKFNGIYSTPELEALKDISWRATEKVDGTNIRIVIQSDGSYEILGRTDNAMFLNGQKEAIAYYVPSFIDDFKSEHEVVVYGECYGYKLQSNPLKKNGLHFIVFDIKIGNQWLDYEFVVDYCDRNHIPYTNTYGFAPLSYWEQQCAADAVYSIENPGCKAEGYVLRPHGVQLFDKHGKRIITKLKVKDYV